MKKQLTLGQLINKLEPIIAGLEKEHYPAVVYDFGYFAPTEIDSWRGSYSELALNYTNVKSLDAYEFLSLLKSAINKKFEGYKGGDYFMTDNTPIWVSNYSESCGTAIVDVLNAGWQIVLITEYKEY